ncbi:putative mitochondrial D-alanyl-glycyl endopeptidase-like protein [Leptomonas pyrrhocoris]|uniref:Putative mitochondrial D-alanyl-glycyl endopeptidase-like protein n=1 Tax=Leptomonas pyrrhocoris TaxID=157538 RepID=A0A0N0DYQ7_LEPPY|nr:putative mitochondrial D-alanyl-glycyl endopeptidase-like protein [Leptomonas pyrrhocoris]KPA84371.1 putative mitochondrial D-alanyl-glycyl endopeptidase-like protein [Leptomonas pyrrhocoris]|eukprot:XP_015662810.1 putative mitochondrial D-alanyl-glycyl endopeptidase-like protein [Leptomonas pyrrhocoris]
MLPNNMGNSNPGSGGREAGDAAVPFLQRIRSESDTAEGNAAVSVQRNHSSSPHTATACYGGTETHALRKRNPKVSDSGERSSKDDGDVVVVPSRAGGGGGGSSGNNSRPDAGRDVEGECIVVNDNGTDTTADTCMGKVRHFLLNSDSALYALLKWGLAVLLLFFLSFVVFGMIYSEVRYNGNCTVDAGVTDTPALPEGCESPFGAILGAFQNTFAHSNCNGYYVSTVDSYMNFTVPVMDAATGMLTMSSKEFYTGLAWQCVEYARRYWMINGRPKPAYFGSVIGAADIWNLTEVHLLENTSRTLPLRKYKSGDRVVQDGLQPPQAGDIIIYPVQSGGFPVGHVAVVTKVEMGEQGFIYVAEQNWESTQWSGPFYNYSRKIPLRYDPLTTAIILNDPDGKIIGWMRYG